MILIQLSDSETTELITNQKIIIPDLINTLINLNIQYNYTKTSFLNSLLYQSKYKTLEHIVLSMNLVDFLKYIENLQKNLQSKNLQQNIEQIINNYILKNKNILSQKENINNTLKIAHMYATKSYILNNVYKLISNDINGNQKKEILNKAITTFDKNLILMILEKKDIVLDIDIICKLIEKSNHHSHKQTADIIDILCDYGLVVDKKIIIKLLERNCYVNNLEIHGITVDNDILAICAHHNFYPYKFDIVPNTEILKKECSKSDNITTIKKLKEFGGIYTTECLEEACKISGNKFVLKFLINDCDVKVSDKCLQNFQETYNIGSLDILMSKYKSQNPIEKNITDEIKHIELNEKSTMSIIPKNIEVNIKDDTVKLELKNKIRKFFDYKKKIITYKELYELTLKYLITNKLVIGKYFVVDTDLSNLLNINNCVIMNINELYNILTYFVDVIKN